MGQTVFICTRSKIFFLKFHFIFSFLKVKEYVSPMSQASKRFLKKNLVDFMVTAQIFEGLATKERGNIKT